MIKPVQLDAIQGLSDIIEEYASTRGEVPSSQVPLVDQLKAGLEAERVAIFAWYDKTDVVVGFVAVGRVSNRIPIVYAKDASDESSEQIERKLFDTAFEFLKEATTHIKAGGGNDVSENLLNHMRENGFIEWKRARMTLSKEQVLDMEEVIIPEGYSFEPYVSEMRDEISDLLLRGNQDVDVNVFPEFFEDFEACKKLIENVENSRYGKYYELQSQVLKNNGEIVGVCFLTFTADDTGYIPEICISPDHRRKGLGRAISVYSFQELIKSEEKTARINLDVTLKNPALNLYQSLGFQETSTYSMCSWKK